MDADVTLRQILNPNDGRDMETQRWMTQIALNGFALLGGLPEDQETINVVQPVMEKLGSLRRTFFEPKGVWDITVKAGQSPKEHADSAYSNVALDPHVDGCYFADSPGLQFFHIPCHDGEDRKSTRLNSSHRNTSRMPSSA